MPGRGPRQRDGVVLGPGEARVQRDVPSHRPQAPAPLRQRICGTAQHEGARHHVQDALNRSEHGRQETHIRAAGGPKHAVRQAVTAAGSDRGGHPAQEEIRDASSNVRFHAATGRGLAQTAICRTPSWPLRPSAAAGEL